MFRDAFGVTLAYAGNLRYRQQRVTTSSGSDSPLSVTSRGAESVIPGGVESTVSRLARISPASASAEMRAAACTPFPRYAAPCCCADAV